MVHHPIFLVIPLTQASTYSTETFVVSWYYENEPWRSTGKADPYATHPRSPGLTNVLASCSGERIDCAGTKDCTQTNIVSNDTCTENKITDENSLKAEFELKLPKWFGEAFDNPDLSFSWNVGTDSVTTEQICKKTTSSGYGDPPFPSPPVNSLADSRTQELQMGRRGMSWHLDLATKSSGTVCICFSFRSWSADINPSSHDSPRGYQRRTCKTGRKSGGPPPINKPEAEQLRNDGLYTIGMQDFSLLVPSSTNVGCAAECDATNYPVPMGPPSRALPIQYAG